MATFASSAATLLAPSIVAATARHPRRTALTVEVDVDAVTRVVERGGADLAFGLEYPDAGPSGARDRGALRVATERFGLAVPDAWQMPDAVRLADAAQLDWIPRRLRPTTAAR